MFYSGSEVPELPDLSQDATPPRPPRGQFRDTQVVPGTGKTHRELFVKAVHDKMHQDEV